MNFILVHLGDHFYDYINDCINQIFKFNDCQVYLIIDHKHNDRIHKKINLTILDPKDLNKTHNHLFFDEINILDRNFRGGFWKFTTERFLYIEDLITQTHLKNVFHLENDNLIFFDVNDHLKTFSENYQIATVFDNDQRAVPGFVYIKDLESILNFNKFVNNFNNTNDMELFSLYNNSNQLKMNLPILPTNYDLDLKSQTGLTTKNPQQFFKNYDKFNSVFDAASIGQFIGGIDGRNINSNKDTSGFINESCLFSMKNFQVDFLKDDYKRRVPYLNYKDRICKINNLHIHSKNLKKYLS
jgi:hypothetical protein